VLIVSVKYTMLPSVHRNVNVLTEAAQPAFNNTHSV